MLEIGTHANERMNERNITINMVEKIYKYGVSVKSYNNSTIKYLPLKTSYRKNCVDYTAVAIVYGKNTKNYGDDFLMTAEFVPANVLYAFRKCRENNTVYNSRNAA